MYLSTTLLHVPLDLPLFLFLCGFQSNAFLIILLSFSLKVQVCPIHLQCLFPMSPLTGFCPVLLHTSSLVILSVHLIPSSLRKHILMKTWVRFVHVLEAFHVSHPLQLKIINFVLREMSFVLQILFNDMKTVWAFPMLDFTSAPVPSSPPTIFPR